MSCPLLRVALAETSLGSWSITPLKEAVNPRNSVWISVTYTNKRQEVPILNVQGAVSFWAAPMTHVAHVGSGGRAGTGVLVAFLAPKGDAIRLGRWAVGIGFHGGYPSFLAVSPVTPTGTSRPSPGKVRVPTRVQARLVLSLA